MKEEMVLVVRRELLEKLGHFQGLTTDIETYLPALLARENNFFSPRSAAELDPSLKQIIPYAILTFQNRILRYRRGKRSGEQRLVAKGSIGIGGHMNDRDEGLFALNRDAYLGGVEREISEEVRIASSVRNEIVALINDDSTEVGRVHLGIVHLVELSSAEVEKRESMITGLAFLTLEQLRAELASLETWSQICVQHLDRLLR
jgi:predicted NUDIX family phosphoesterase